MEASTLTAKPLKTYCLVYEQEINEKGRDQELARTVSERFGTRHREVLLTPGLLMAELPAISGTYVWRKAEARSAGWCWLPF